MLRLTFRNLAANKGRFAMTTLAIVLGVGFVVASFVLSDGLRSSFGSLSDEITDGTDLAIRPTSEFGEPLPLDESVVDVAASIPGVRHAVAYVEGPENALQPIKSDGETIPAFGPPQLTFAWIDDPALSSFTLVEGEAPDDPGEFTMDVDAASTHGFVVGDGYDLVTPTGIEVDVELVGTTSFGENNDTVGATLMHLSLLEAQRIFGVDGVNEVLVSVERGVDAESVSAAVSAALGLGEPGVTSPNIEIVDQATVNAEQRAEFDEGVDLIGNVLLGFAIVSLFVSIFIIYNTFSIVLGQRVREMGLLRALGADARQIRRSVLGEAVVVGVVASTIGVVAGIGIARGLSALFDALGASPPSFPTILAARTVLLAYILGVGVTVVSAIAPARAAGLVSPISALRDSHASRHAMSRRRVIWGASVLAGGLALGIVGLAGGVSGTLPLTITLGTAALLVFVGVLLTSPVVARPVTRAAGWPIARLRGTPGRLARENAMRDPVRTATTGSALVIGLALVITGFTVGESIKTRLGDLLESSVEADYLITPGDGTTPFSPTLADDLEADGSFDHVTGVRYTDARIGGKVRGIAAGELESIDSLFDLGVVTGGLPAAGSTDVVAMPSGLATDLGVEFGDSITAEFSTGMSIDLEVVIVYDDTAVFGEPIVSDALFDAAGESATHAWVAAGLADDATAADVAPLVSEIGLRYPNVSVDTAAEFREQFEATIDSAMMVINVLLALAILIALIGISNTLALSVHERTREIGLLRAVGMTRSEIRRMVRWEAVLVALFGAVVGVAIGVVFGWGIVTALPDDAFGGSLSIPFVPIFVVVLIAALATLIAAMLPARRAGRLDVLDAISLAT